MRKLGCGLLLAGLLAGQSARADSTLDTMKAFGLIGTWSLDCAKPMATCDKTGCGSRNIYGASPSGQIVSQFVMGSAAPGQTRTIQTEIQGAIKIADDKIKLISTQQYPYGTPLPTSRLPGERWETVLIKSGDKLRTLTAQREDGQKITIEDGFVVRAENPYQLPTKWIRTTIQTGWFARCAPTGESVPVAAALDVVIKSNVSGYAVTFPSQPTSEIKNTSAGKLSMNLLRSGDNMFVSSEATLIVADMSTQIDASIAAFVKSFPVAVVMDKKTVSFTTTSGKALPARTFTFVNMDFYGEGLVVVSGPHLITVAAMDMSKKPSKTSEARLALKKFVSSLKIEK
jgi:hypothetical protein